MYTNFDQTPSEYYRCKAFIQQALRDRRDHCKDYLISGIFAKDYDDLFDQFVELICECGLSEGQTARTIVDNRIINGQYWDYLDFVVDFMDHDFYEKLKDIDPTDRDLKDLEDIEDKMIDHRFYFDRKHFLFHD